MRTQIITKTLAKFNELSEENKKKVIDKNRDINVSDDFWFEYLMSNFQDILKSLGFSEPKVYFSYSFSQGDGACFVSKYFSYDKGMLKTFKELGWEDEELTRLSKEIFDIYRRSFYQYTGQIAHLGHYYHENSMMVYTYENFYGEYDKFEKEMKEWCKDFSHWMFSLIKKEYEFQTSDFMVSASIKADGYEFEVDENGDIV